MIRKFTARAPPQTARGMTKPPGLAGAAPAAGGRGPVRRAGQPFSEDEQRSIEAQVVAERRRPRLPSVLSRRTAGHLDNVGLERSSAHDRFRMASPHCSGSGRVSRYNLYSRVSFRRI